MKKNGKMSTCHQLVLETLGPRLIDYAQKSPGYCFDLVSGVYNIAGGFLIAIPLAEAWGILAYGAPYQ